MGEGLIIVFQGQKDRRTLLIAVSTETCIDFKRESDKAVTLLEFSFRRRPETREMNISVEHYVETEYVITPEGIE